MTSNWMVSHEPKKEQINVRKGTIKVFPSLEKFYT